MPFKPKKGTLCISRLLLGLVIEEYDSISLSTVMRKGYRA